MSEIIEKTAEEQLADVVKSEVAAVAEAKADVAAVEELKAAVEAIEVPSVEGFVKAEELAAAAEEVATLKSELEALNAKFDSAPAIVTKEAVEPMSYVFKEADLVDQHTFAKSIDIFEKAELSTNNAADAPVGNAPIWTDLVAGNPFRAPGMSMIMPVSSASYKVPELSGITSGKNQNAGSQSEGGAVADVTVNVNQYASRFDASVALVEDLPGLDGIVGSKQAMVVADAEHEDIVAALDAATITEQAFANAAAFEDMDNWADLAARLGVQYWQSSTWVMSLGAYGALIKADQSGTGSNLAFDPSMGARTLYGRPIVLSSQMDALGANANPVYFGDFGRAVLIGARRDMSFRRVQDAVNLDGYTYYTVMRSGQSVTETDALVRADQTA